MEQRYNADVAAIQKEFTLAAAAAKRDVAMALAMGALEEARHANPPPRHLELQAQPQA